jgi:hypothetical protein
MAEGRMSEQEFSLFRQAASAVFSNTIGSKSQSRFEHAALAVALALSDRACPNWQTAVDVSEYAARAVAASYGTVAEECAAQALLLRDIFDNAFRHRSLSPALLAWNNSTVVKLAQGIYDDRAFDRLPVLADAIEDAGYHDAYILNHCREPGNHVRGCWVVDLLLGKE